MMTRWNAISLERRVPIVHVCFVTSRCLWRIKHSPRQLTENTQSCHVETNWPITDAVSKTHQSQSTLHGAEPTNEDGDYCVLHDFGLCRPQNWYGVLGKGNGRFFWGKAIIGYDMVTWRNDLAGGGQSLVDVKRCVMAFGSVPSKVYYIRRPPARQALGLPPLAASGLTRIWSWTASNSSSTCEYIVSLSFIRASWMPSRASQWAARRIRMFSNC